MEILQVKQVHKIYGEKENKVPFLWSRELL